jgi:hypothetical protein
MPCPAMSIVHRPSSIVHLLPDASHLASCCFTHYIATTYPPTIHSLSPSLALFAQLGCCLVVVQLLLRQQTGTGGNNSSSISNRWSNQTRPLARAGRERDDAGFPRYEPHLQHPHYPHYHHHITHFATQQSPRRRDHCVRTIIRGSNASHGVQCLLSPRHPPLWTA